MAVSEVGDELEDEFVLLGDSGGGIFAVEVLLVVEADIGLQGLFAEAEGEAGGEAMTFEVIGLQASGVICRPFAVV